jgi:hypothetical protein
MGLFADEYCCAWLRFSLLHTFTECLLLISINPAPRASFSEIIPYYGAGQRHHSAHDLVELNDATDRTLPQRQLRSRMQPLADEFAPVTGLKSPRALRREQPGCAEVDPESKPDRSLLPSSLRAVRRVVVATRESPFP